MKKKRGAKRIGEVGWERIEELGGESSNTMRRTSNVNTCRGRKGIRRDLPPRKLSGPPPNYQKYPVRVQQFPIHRPLETGRSSHKEIGVSLDKSLKKGGLNRKSIWGKRSLVFSAFDLLG